MKLALCLVVIAWALVAYGCAAGLIAYGFRKK